MYLKIFLLSFFLFAPQAFATEITDDSGEKIILSSPSVRVISLLPSITESVCSIGQCTSLVGVDDYSNSPPPVKALPHLGGGLTPNIELLVSLKPDLVLLSNNQRVIHKLQQLGIKVFVIDTQTHEDVRRSLNKLDLIFNTHKSQSVWQSMQTEITKVAKSLPSSVKNLRVYFEVSTGPYAAGQSSFIGETLSRLGVQNIVPKSLGEFPKLNPEFIVKADPELIIVGDNNLLDLTQRPGWKQLSAIKANRVCALSKDQSDVVLRPGPRMGEGAQIIANCITTKGLIP